MRGGTYISLPPCCKEMYGQPGFCNLNLCAARTRCSASSTCCSGVLSATKRIDGREAASQMACASACFLFAVDERTHELWGDQASLVPERPAFARQPVGARAGLHGDDAGRCLDKPCIQLLAIHLPAREGKKQCLARSIPISVALAWVVSR